MKNNNFLLLFFILIFFIILYLFFNYKREKFYGISNPKSNVKKSSVPYVGSYLYGRNSKQAVWSRW